MKLLGSLLVVMVLFLVAAGRTEAALTSTTPVPFSVIEGQVFNRPVMSFTANDAGPFTATINWGDGTAPSAGTIAPVGGGFQVSGTHTYADDGHYTVSVSITDTADATVAANTTTATVGEAVLTSTSQPFTVAEGALYNGIVGLFTDPGSPAPVSNYTGTIAWGDGTTTPGSVVLNGGPGNFAVTGIHTYLDEGSFTAVTTFFDNDEPGFTISTSSTATVTEADVLTPHPVSFSATEGSAFSGSVGTFSDTYTGAPASDFTATINWGDATSTAGVVSGAIGGPFTVTGTHTYTEAGAYSVAVTLSDDAPGTATATAVSTAHVADAALTATGINPSFVPAVPGSPKVAHFTDANPTPTLSDFTATINWGDGSLPSSGTIAAAAGGGFDVGGTHTYSIGGTYTITTTINDVGGATATATSTAKLGADLAVTKSGPISAIAATNVTYALTIVNNGPADAPGVTISDTLPANTSFVSAAQSTGPAFGCTTPPVGSGGTITCTIALLPSGVSASFSNVLMISGATSGGTVLTNTATASSGIPDPTPGNNTSTVNTTVVAGTAPAITSANATTFTVGTAGSFTVTATGSPAPTLTMTGAPPSLVTFNPATGVLSGTPAAGTQGTYNLTFTAANGVPPNATQTFTLTVNPVAPVGVAPVITSPNTATFVIGTPGTFTVTAVGTPAPALSQTAALPAGVTFSAATGLLSGTPAAGSQGTYPLVFTASNGIAPNAVQNFTLTVNPACQPNTKGCQPFVPTTIGPPKITKAFGYAPTKSKLSFNVGDTTTLTFTVSNQNTATALTGVGFTDVLPAGLVVSTPNGLTGSCGGAISAVAGGSAISLTGATLAPFSNCSFTVNVTATSSGAKNNTTSIVTSNEGGSGTAATASLTVT